jgi:PAS domain S-box-containing protein
VPTDPDRKRSPADRTDAFDGEELLTALLDSTIDAVYAVDADGRVLFANPAAVRILGYDDEDQLLGCPSHATIHHHHPDGTPFPESECPLLRPRSNGEPVRVDEDWFVRRDGTFVAVAYSASPVNVGGARGAVVVFSDLSDRRRAESEYRRAQELHASRARIVAAMLEERRRLGRDLHDGAQQRLINVVVALQLAAQRSGDEQARGSIADALKATQQAIDDLRDFGAGLHPSVLSHRGLKAAVSSLTGRMPIPVSIDIPDQRFTEVTEGTAYFVIAEALANVVKHAQASEAQVSVSVAGDKLVVVVADNGRGGAGREGSGLVGLTDRVAAIGGTLSLHSPLDTGTTLTVTLPIA